MMMPLEHTDLRIVQSNGQGDHGGDQMPSVAHPSGPTGDVTIAG